MSAKHVTTPLKSSTSGVMSLLGASLLWALSFGLIKTHLAGLDPFFVASVRLVLSFLLFAPLMRWRGLGRRLAWQLLGIGAVQYGLMYVAYIRSYQYLAGHEVALFTILTPLYVLLMHTMGQWRWRMWGAGLVAVLGAAIILFRMPDRGIALRGILLLQLANLAFAFGQVAYRHVMRTAGNRPRDREVFAILFAGGALFAATACAASGGWAVAGVSRLQVAVLLYLGLIPSGVGFFLWNRGARRVEHGLLAVLNNAKIPLAVLVTVLLFRERVDLVRLLAGGGLMLGAAWLAQSTRRGRSA